MDGEFNGKRALVTGAGQGIGRTVAIALAKLGAEVIALSRTPHHLETLKLEVPSIKTVSLDISDWQSTLSTVRSLLPIDLLVNNAGAASLGSFGEVSEDEINRVFSVNFKAALNIAQVVANDLKSRGQPGAIVNVSSQASLVAIQDHTVYCASKAALDAMTKVMALELGPHQIRVNSVNPTVVLTELAKPAWGDPAKGDPMKAKIPLGRFAAGGPLYPSFNDGPCVLLPLGVSSYQKDGNTVMRHYRPSPYEPYFDVTLPNTTEDAIDVKETEDVANAIVFLLSTKSAMVTGTCLPVDGGYTVH